MVAQWAKTYEGPLGLKFEDDLSIGAMSPNALSGQPQLEKGMVLLSINGNAVAEGMTKGAAIAAIQAAGRPLTLVFQSAAGGLAQAAAAASDEPPVRTRSSTPPLRTFKP